MFSLMTAGLFLFRFLFGMFNFLIFFPKIDDKSLYMMGYFSGYSVLFGKIINIYMLILNY